MQRLTEEYPEVRCVCCFCFCFGKMYIGREMIPRSLQAFVIFYGGAFGCEGMSICRSMDRTHRIDTILCLAKTDGHCGSNFLPEICGWLIFKDPDLVQGVNTNHWMNPCLSTLVDLEKLSLAQFQCLGLNSTAVLLLVRQLTNPREM